MDDADVVSTERTGGGVRVESRHLAIGDVVIVEVAQFHDRRCYPAYAVNAVSTDPCGIGRYLRNIYSYKNTHRSRQKLHSFHRATADTRDEPVSIIIHGPHPEHGNFPHLVACVMPLGWGKTTERNEKARQAIASSKDLHYVGLQMDTSVNRRQHFQNCLKIKKKRISYEK